MVRHVALGDVSFGRAKLQHTSASEERDVHPELVEGC